MNSEYITVKHKASTIKWYQRYLLFIIVPAHIALIVFSLVVIKFIPLAVICALILCYTAWKYFHWHKLLKEGKEK